MIFSLPTQNRYYNNNQNNNLYAFTALLMQSQSTYTGSYGRVLTIYFKHRDLTTGLNVFHNSTVTRYVIFS